MNRVNEYLEPGVYVDDDQKYYVVVLDVLNHIWNSNESLQESLSIPVVVVRNLSDDGLKGHQRFGYPLDVFQEKFKKA